MITRFFKNIYHYLLISYSGLFDCRYYLEAYPDIRKADIDPLWHFIKFGWKENRNPSSRFNIGEYLTFYPDVKAAGINPLIHYYRYGKMEGKITKINNKLKLNHRKVGVVIVSYNASMAVRATLSSIRNSVNETPYKLILVDNASDQNEREIIRKTIETGSENSDLLWEYIQLEENRGFSGGNNMGIQQCLRDETITHVCLLNSDVIVTDHWLDRLVERDFDILSPVTNKSESTQVVPVDYSFELKESFNNENGEIDLNTYQRIKDFTEKWHSAWRGNSVPVDHVTFFCVLLSREVIRKVGLLDNHFFPGGYEDNDYCIRARNEQFSIGLIRDVFIHHWGSASFGQLSRNSFNERSIANRKYLEKKQGIIWKAHPEDPFISLKYDVTHALTGKGDSVVQKYFLRLYQNQLQKVISYYNNDLKILSVYLQKSDKEIPETIIRSLQEFQKENIVDHFLKVFNMIFDKSIRSSINLENQRKILGDLDWVINYISRYASLRVKINELFNTSVESLSGVTILSREQKLSAAVSKVRKGLKFLKHLDGIIIFGGYPYEFRQNDGYFQRVKSIDNVFAKKTRIYIDNVYIPGRTFWYGWPEKDVLVLNMFGSKIRKIKAVLLSLICIIRTRKVYFHSVLAAKRFVLLFKMPFLKKVIDLHGVVPEEFRYNGDFQNGDVYEKVERQAIKKADYIVTVTDTMRQYLIKKYGKSIRGKFIVLPIFSEEPEKVVNPHNGSANSVIVYAGGLQKWQQVQKMAGAIISTSDKYHFKFFCPNPDEFKKLIPEQLIHTRMIEIGSKTKVELNEEYKTSDFGLILREDIVVNRVACPTKLVEYLMMGIVPIIESENIGDFASLGMKYVLFDQLIQKKLPDEETRIEMAKSNYSVLLRLHQQFKVGKEGLFSHLFPTKTRKSDIDLPFEHDYEGENLGIGLVVNSFDKGGLEQAVFNLYEGYRKNGFRSYIFSQTDNVGHFAKKLHSPQHLFVFNNDKEKFLSFCKEMKINWLHYHYNTFQIDKVGDLGIKTIYSIQNIYSWFSDFEIQERAKFINKADLIIAGSTFSKEYYCKRTGTPLSGVDVIPIGVNIEDLDNTYLDPKYSRKALNISENDIVLCFVASFHEVKHQMNMIGAMEKIIKVKPNVKLIFLGNIGHKAYFSKVKKSWVTSSARNNIVHIPFIDHSQLGEFLRKTTDIFILPTIQEGCSNAVIDALYCGKPMLLTDVGNASDLQHLDSVTVVPRPYEDLYAFRQKDIKTICLEKESSNNDAIVQGILNIIDHLDEQIEAAKSAAQEYAEQCDKNMMAMRYIKYINEKESASK